MPTGQFVTAIIEQSLNRLLRLDADSQSRLQPLQGKQLMVTVDELPIALLFGFSQQVHVMVASAAHKTTADAYISLSLQTLSQLKDSSQVSQLIQQQKLVLEGDMRVAQDFSNVMARLQIDWEETLSRYTGDVVAHQLFRLADSVLGKVSQASQHLNTMVSDLVLEERPVGAHPAAIDEFNQQVNQLRSDTERLLARVAQLETKRKQ